MSENLSADEKAPKNSCALTEPLPCFLPNPSAILLGLYEAWYKNSSCTEQEKCVICDALKTSTYMCGVLNKPRLESIAYSLHNTELHKLSELSGILSGASEKHTKIETKAL